jgi:hypothetical protein
MTRNSKVQGLDKHSRGEPLKVSEAFRALAHSIFSFHPSLGYHLHVWPAHKKRREKKPRVSNFFLRR